MWGVAAALAAGLAFAVDAAHAQETEAQEKETAVAGAAEGEQTAEKAAADAGANAEAQQAAGDGEKTNPYTGDEEAIAEGRKLYLKYNCYGCHGTQGGGGMGKPISDDQWVAGGDDASVFDVVYNGTTGGMPPFKDILTEDETWKVIAFVRSLYKGDPAKVVW